MLCPGFSQVKADISLIPMSKVDRCTKCLRAITCLDEVLVKPFDTTSPKLGVIYRNGIETLGPQRSSQRLKVELSHVLHGPSTNEVQERLESPPQCLDDSA
eukprot:1667463-Amphidinium_carterae.1